MVANDKFVELVQKYLDISSPSAADKPKKGVVDYGGYEAEIDKYKDDAFADPTPGKFKTSKRRDTSKKFKDRMRGGGSSKFFKEEYSLESELIEKLTPIIEQMLRR